MLKGKVEIGEEEVCKILAISKIKLARWVEEGKIPCKYRLRGYYFIKSEVLKWARERRINFKEENKEFLNSLKENFLSYAISSSPVNFSLKGNNIQDVFKNAVEIILNDRKEFSSLSLLDELLKRESVASTGVGNGVALPHPCRNKDLDINNLYIPFFRLEKGVDFRAVDGKDVSLLFFIFSPTPQLHLKTLSRIGHFLREDEFVAFLKSCQSHEQLVSEIKKREQLLN